MLQRYKGQVNLFVRNSYTHNLPRDIADIEGKGLVTALQHLARKLLRGIKGPDLVARRYGPQTLTGAIIHL